MFILLETWPDVIFVNVVCNEDGEAMVFDTREEAEVYNKENLQGGVIVEL